MDNDFISIQDCCKLYNVDRKTFDTYCIRFNIETIKEKNNTFISNESKTWFDNLFNSYDKNDIKSMLLSNTKPFSCKGITYLNLRKQLNLTLKQFVNKISHIGLELKSNYTAEEENKIREFCSNGMNKVELKEIDYVNQGYIPLRTILKDINISKGTLTSYVNLLKIEVYKPSHELSFITESDKEKLLNFINEHNDSNERKIYLSKQTCLKKYGVENASKTKESKEKTKYKNTINSKERLEKARKTNLKRYGVENTFKLHDSFEYWKSLTEEEKKIRNKKISQSRIKFKESETDKIFLDELENIFNKDRSGIAKTLIKLNINNIVKNNYFIYKKDLPILEDYYKTTSMCGTSFVEKQVLSFVKSVTSEIVLENDKSFGKELDIYIPNKKIAIEVDGVFWHSNSMKIREFPNANKDEINYWNNKIKNKQLNKTLMCENNNIRLIHFWDYEWNTKKDICKSIISSALGIYKEKYFARKLTIKEMSKKELNNMFETNHIIGKTNTIEFGLGLFNDNECIQCMSFTNSKRDFKSKSSSIELNRMCTKLNTQVVGGFSKLLKNAVKIFNLKNIDSYIDRRMFDGKGYIVCGFKIINYSKPSYLYLMKDNSLKNRQYGLLSNFKLRSENGNGYYDENLTESELAWKNKIPRVYNCGTIKISFNT